MTLSKINSEQNISDVLWVARYSWIYPRHKYCISQPSWHGSGRGRPCLYAV